MRKEYTDHNLNPSKELSSNEPKDNCLDGHDFRKAINNPYVGNLKGTMTVKDLFAICDREKLMSCIATKHEDVPDGVDIMEAVAAQYVPVLEELERLTPASGQEHIVLGMLVEGRVEAMDFYMPEVKIYFRPNSVLRWMTEEAICNSHEALEWASLASVPESYVFCYTPWAEILDMRVCAYNVASVGAEELAANILYDMTFCGFTAKAIDEKIKELQEALNDTKYDSLADLLEDAIIEKRSDPTEEKRLAYKRKNALYKHRVYHLLLKYQDWWQEDENDRCSTNSGEV